MLSRLSIPVQLALRQIEASTLLIDQSLKPDQSLRGNVKEVELTKRCFLIVTDAQFVSDVPPLLHVL